MASVVVVDDCEAVRTGLAVLLGLEPDIEVLGEASNGAQALELAVQLCPDVVVMDVMMPVCDGVTATARISKACPQTRVLLLTFDDDPSTFQLAVAAGTSGYVLKDAGAEAVVAAVRAVLAGQHPGIDDAVSQASA